MSPPADILGAVPTWAGVLALTALAVAAASAIVWRRIVRPVMLGRPGGTDRPLERLAGAVRPVLGQAKVLQSVSARDRAGLAHLAIFWGFLSFLLSYLLFIFADSAWPPLSERVLTPLGVTVFAAYLDVLAALLIAVVCWAAARRWIAAPPRLSFDLTRRPEAAAILAAVAALMALSLISGAALSASGDAGPHARSPVSGAIGAGLGALGLGEGGASAMHAAAWWLHLCVILGFGVYIPLSKHAHVLGAPASFFMRSLGAPSALSTPDLETAESFGAGAVRDFSRKQLIDGYACAVCGRCTEACPAAAAGRTLSPMHVVVGLRDHLAEAGPALAAGAGGEPELIGPRVPTEAVWDCLTCGACVAECPVGVEHVGTIVDMRRHLVLERGEMPDGAREALTSLETRGHPWRGTPHSRADWAEGLGVPTLAERPDAEHLLWVGCTAALETRSRSVARSLARVLLRAGVDFAILGEEERCTGDPARRMGNEYLYQVLARANIEALRARSVRRIITLCPHCMNVMRNEYPALGGEFEVVHYTEIVARLIDSGALAVAAAPEPVSAAYHDSCYLGRHNGVYDEPRRIARAIPGLELTEMEHSRRRGFCCGAGGGRMWMEDGAEGRVDALRADQFIATGAETVIVSCPFCLQMLGGALPGRPGGADRRAVDLIELVDAAAGD